MNLTDTILEASRERGNDIALSYRGSDIAYGQLAESILNASCGLAALGVTRGDCVIIVMRNCPEFIIGYLATLRLGAMAVPVNPAASVPEMLAVARTCNAAGALVQSRFLEAFDEVCAVHQFGFVAVADGQLSSDEQTSFDEICRDRGKAPLPQPPTEDCVAALLFTSGVTGQSKAVMLTHGNIISNAQDCIEVFGAGAEDRYIAVLPFFHCFGWTVTAVMPLIAGARIVIVESVQPFSDVLEALAAYKVSVFVGVPAMFAALLKTPGLTPEAVGGAMRWCLSGAAPLSVDVQRKFEERFGVPLIQGYGLTEASPVVATNPVHGLKKHGSIGPSAPGVTTRIISPEGHDVPQGEIGELVAQGPNIMKGYYNDPESTAAAFTSDGFLRTGDLAYADADGYIFVVDRLKDLIIVKGLNVYPAEVEAALLEHPGVAEAAVVGVPDEIGDESVRAYVVLKDGHEALPHQLIDLCEGRLAPYKIPRSVVILDEMPKNTLGKTLRRVLRDLARAQRV